jgi:hypothetical protein
LQKPHFARDGVARVLGLAQAEAEYHLVAD